MQVGEFALNEFSDNDKFDVIISQINEIKHINSQDKIDIEDLTGETVKISQAIKKLSLSELMEIMKSDDFTLLQLVNNIIGKQYNNLYNPIPTLHNIRRLAREEYFGRSKSN